MRAIPVIDETSIEIARSYEGVADFVLLDSYDPATTRSGRSAAPMIGASADGLSRTPASRSFSQVGSVPRT